MGLSQVLRALADFPAVSETFLAQYERSVKVEIKLTDVISGFVDIYAEANPAPTMTDATSDSANSDDDSDDDPPPNPLDPEEVLQRFGKYKKHYKESRQCDETQRSRP